MATMKLIDLCIFSFSKILAPQSYSDNSSLNKVYVCMYVCKCKHSTDPSSFVCFVFPMLS